MADEARGVVLAETKYLRLVQHGHWTYAQRPNVTGAMAIAAVTADGQLLLVDQFRIPVQSTRDRAARGAGRGRTGSRG